MHIDFLVEEASAEAALQNLLPRMLGPDVTFSISPHEGKADLLAKLPGRLRGYRKWIPEHHYIVVLVDTDADDCRELEGRLEMIAREAGFPTAAAASGRRFRVLNRLAIEELEAWFLGDITAVCKAYPRTPATVARRAAFRDPDHVAGGTWQALQRVLQRAGYYPTGIPKIEAARAISAHMVPERNRSKSFQVFRSGLAELVAQGQNTAAQNAITAPLPER
jgi:hypothetical protein